MKKNLHTPQSARHVFPRQRNIDFKITDITPLPVGSPDDVWDNFKKTVKNRGLDGLMLSILDHGALISYGPKEVEIGFTKSFYKEQFETYLKTKPELMTVIEDLFGPVQTRVLVLSNISFIRKTIL